MNTRLLLISLPELHEHGALAAFSDVDDAQAFVLVNGLNSYRREWIVDRTSYYGDMRRERPCYLTFEEEPFRFALLREDPPAHVRYTRVLLEPFLDSTREGKRPWVTTWLGATGTMVTKPAYTDAGPHTMLRVTNSTQPWREGLNFSVITLAATQEEARLIAIPLLEELRLVTNTR